MAALWCRNLPEGAALELTVRRMWLHFFAVAWSLLESPVALVVLGVVLLRSAPMYSALGVCACVVVACVCTGLLSDVALYIKRDGSLFR